MRWFTPWHIDPGNPGTLKAILKLSGFPGSVWQLPQPDGPKGLVSLKNTSYHGKSQRSPGMPKFPLESGMQSEGS